MAYRPENTLVSFAHAAALGADLVELDVHQTRDGHLVVIHDDTLERTTNGRGYVHDHTLAELRQLDAGSWFDARCAGERIPTLDAVLAWASASGVGVDVEIKHDPLSPDGVEQAVVEALQRHGMSERALVTSFDHPTVGRVKPLDPRVATGVLYEGRSSDAVALARAADADALLPHWAEVRPEDVEAAHGADVAIAPWATSDAAVMRRLVELGVDAIVTNHPDLLRQVLDEAASSAVAGVA